MNTSPKRTKSPKRIDIDWGTDEESDEKEFKHFSSIPIVKKVAGATEISLLQKGDKMIYLFGETHVPARCSNQYVSIVDFIDAIMVQQDVKVDLFIEMFGSTHVESKNRDNELGIINRLASPCIPPRTDDCRYGINHVHWVDARRHGAYNGLIKFSMFPQKLRALNLPKEEIVGKFQKQLYWVLDALMIDGDVVPNIPIEKELSRANPDYKVALLKLFARQKNIYKQLKKMLVQDDVDAMYAMIMDPLDPFMHWIIRETSYLMDVYALTRMLKPNIENIIYYAGMHHTKEARIFLMNNGFVLVHHAQRVKGPEEMIEFAGQQSFRIKGSDCLDISHFKQPFFDRTR